MTCLHKSSKSAAHSHCPLTAAELSLTDCCFVLSFLAFVAITHFGTSNSAAYCQYERQCWLTNKNKKGDWLFNLYLHTKFMLTHMDPTFLHWSQCAQIFFFFRSTPHGNCWEDSWNTTSYNSQRSASLLVSLVCDDTLEAQFSRVIHTTIA